MIVLYQATFAVIGFIIPLFFRYFAQVVDPDTGTTSHVYKGGYWANKVNDDFENSADIF